MDDREYELKQGELTLREREVSAREREVAAKEKKSNLSRWFNPLVIGLVGAALALGGNVLTNILNNRASDHAERVRAQSSLVLSVIKTNGNEDDACKNLNFFVGIGWLDDERGTIHSRCGTKGEGGVPTLPASSNPFDQPPPGTVSTSTQGIIFGPASIQVVDEESKAPIAGAKVELFSTPTSVLGGPNQTAFTDANGVATLEMAFGGEALLVSKDGYEQRGLKPVSQLNDYRTLPMKFPLHRLSKKPDAQPKKD